VTYKKNASNETVNQYFLFTIAYVFLTFLYRDWTIYLSFIAYVFLCATSLNAAYTRNDFVATIISCR